MTQEKFEHIIKIIKIYNRLVELKTIKDEIQNEVNHKLAYISTSNKSSHTIVSEWKQRIIGDLLDKHDRMIREEIDQEIDRLNKEIESL